MYRAMVERDASFDGAFFAGVRTTGIFCRPGCGAKKPRRENVEFFAEPADALRAGFRPCRRCRPLDLAGAPPDWARALFDLVERSSERLKSSDLAAAGIHPARADRWFKEHFGMTFQSYQRARRVSQALLPLAGGASVASTAFDTGFESESGFREAFERLFGAAPTRAARNARVIELAWIATPIGPMLAAAEDAGLCFLEFADRRALASQIAALRRRVGAAIVPGEHRHAHAARRQLGQYFGGERRDFDLPLRTPGTPFQERVWAELRRIPFGATRSYAEVARAIGEPSAFRAVARANGMNRVAIVVPCHRVIGASGELSGYGGGVWRKRALLEHEASVVAGARSDTFERAERLAPRAGE
jgi:AraC family transcriptional regulator of adaptative response/methylated-DNA-[protein]-cysteine methyltransferase